MSRIMFQLLQLATLKSTQNIIETSPFFKSQATQSKSCYFTFLKKGQMRRLLRPLQLFLVFIYPYFLQILQVRSRYCSALSGPRVDLDAIFLACAAGTGKAVCPSVSANSVSTYMASREDTADGFFRTLGVVSIKFHDDQHQIHYFQ